jgi:hypothetical protein
LSGDSAVSISNFNSLGKSLDSPNFLIHGYSLSNVELMWRTAIPHPFYLNFTNFKEENDCLRVILHWKENCCFGMLLLKKSNGIDGKRKFQQILMKITTERIKDEEINRKCVKVKRNDPSLQSWSKIQ